MCAARSGGAHGGRRCEADGAEGDEDQAQQEQRCHHLCAQSQWASATGTAAVQAPRRGGAHLGGRQQQPAGRQLLLREAVRCARGGISRSLDARHSSRVPASAAHRRVGASWGPWRLWRPPSERPHRAATGMAVRSVAGPVARPPAVAHPPAGAERLLTAQQAAHGPDSWAPGCLELPPAVPLARRRPLQVRPRPCGTPGATRADRLWPATSQRAASGAIGPTLPAPCAPAAGPVPCQSLSRPHAAAGARSLPGHARGCASRRLVRAWHRPGRPCFMA